MTTSIQRVSLFCGLGLLSLASAASAAPHRHALQAQPAAATAPSGDDIAAVVNGATITRRDVDNRGRLFALSTGLPISDDVLTRLRPQITSQLIDEKLKTQEILDRHIIIGTDEIAKAIAGIEQRNGMPKNALRDRLAAMGVSMTTLIDQIRVQIGWTHVLRQQLGERARITEDDISQREAGLRAEDGAAEWSISEIFVPVDNPSHAASALQFAETVIKQLRAGAPFPVVAAQFSADQSALDGGARGWVQADGLDPQVVEILRQMPVGAVSNPIKVAGGYSIVTLHDKRTVGHQMATLVSLRQAFLPFSSTLNPAAPTPNQQAVLAKANALSHSARSCDAIEAANKEAGGNRPADPGPLQVDRLNPQMRGVVANLAVGQASRPLVSTDGIDVIMVCSRDQKNLANQSHDEIADQLLNERVEMASRQLTRDLHRRAVIDIRNS